MQLRHFFLKLFCIQFTTKKSESQKSQPKYYNPAVGNKFLRIAGGGKAGGAV